MSYDIAAKVSVLDDCYIFGLFTLYIYIFVETFFYCLLACLLTLKFYMRMCMIYTYFFQRVNIIFL